MAVNAVTAVTSVTAVTTVTASRPVIALTTGEPSGIGPDIALMLAARRSVWRGTQLVLIGDAALLEARARRLGLDARAVLRGVEIGQIGLRAPVRAGRLDARNAPYVLATLDAALAGCVSGEFAAMVTAPVHKGIINDAGIAFTGHTEYLMERTGAKHVVMLLTGTMAAPRAASPATLRTTSRTASRTASDTALRVALATTHLPLSGVPAALTRSSLDATLRVLAHDLQHTFGIARPHILVAGLNPHAGESGYLGREEIDVIAPVIERLKRSGMRLTGPLPADTLFTPRVLAGADAVLAMYHDQGLPVLKFATFGLGINVTLGLPIIRTSVDHGTALDLAVTAAKARSADPGSLVAAFTLARELAAVRAGRQAGKQAGKQDDKQADKRTGARASMPPSVKPRAAARATLRRPAPARTVR